MSFEGNDDVTERHGMNAMECCCGHTFLLQYVTRTVSFILTHARILIERNLEPPFFEGARTVPLTCWCVYITH